MEISIGDLIGECDRALADWPWLWECEADHALPRGMLLAVGSRETNLTNEVGDGGHGHGTWQLDDRSHGIPEGFDGDVAAQASYAAAMLADELAGNGHNVAAAADVYNSGRPYDSATTHGNYGTDVTERLNVIQAHYQPRRPPVPDIVAAQFDPPIAMEPWVAWCPWPSGGTLGLAADGSVYACAGAPYLKGPNGQDYFAARRATRIEYRPAGTPTPAYPNEGYTVIDSAGERYNY